MLGMEMMMKSMGLDPDEIRKYVEQFGAIIIAAKEQLDRVERNQLLIMQHLGIEVPETAAPELPSPETNAATTEGNENEPQ